MAVVLPTTPTPSTQGRLDPCWWWAGRIDYQGYARQGDDFVDRLVCQATTGQRFGERAHRIRIRRLCHDHAPGCPNSRLCPHRSCVNPNHLRVVIAPHRPRKPPRTHCSQGHAMTPENTYCHPDGSRRCRTCRRGRRS